MKKIVFSLLLFLGVAGSLSAQTDRIKPVGGDMGLGFKVSGLANVSISDWKTDHFNVNQLLYRYYVSDKFAIRAGLGLSMGNKSGTFKQETLSGTISTTVDTTFSKKNMNFSIDPGVEYHLGSPAAKVDPYVGVVASISYMGKTETSDRQVTNVKDLSNGTYLSQSDLTTRTITPGGLGYGANLVCGFNYFFSDNFAIGAEYMLGYNAVSTGGDNQVSVNGFTGVPGSITSIGTTTTFTNKNTNSGAAIRSTAGVNLSVFW